MVYPLKKYLIGNIEPRAIFHSEGEKQWGSNFDCPIHRESVEYNKVDVIIGHPDCGHSSVLSYSRAKKFKDPKENSSLILYISSVLSQQPTIFVMENLEALLKQWPLEEFKAIFDDYDLITHIGSVSNFGNSQISRHRLILVGIKKTHASNKNKAFKKVHKLRSLKKTRELLGSLNYPNIELAHIREEDNTIVCMEYQGKKLNLEEVRQRWKALGNQKKWPVNKGNLKNLPGVYKNLADEYPLTARKANRQFNPEGFQMTPRELARIQGLPDRFHIYHDDLKRGYWINKGRATVTKTPPYEIGLWIKTQLKLFYEEY